MKKQFTLLLVAILLFTTVAMSACGSKVETNIDAANNEKPADAVVDNSPAVEENSVGVTVESCRFAKEIRAKDGEVATVVYPETDGKIYVDFVAFIDNQSGEDISSNNATGYVVYDELRYDLQYCSESYTGVSVNDDSVLANNMGRIHLFVKLPAEAENKTDLETVVTIGGKEYREKVSPIDTTDALSRKTELKIGDKESLANGLVEFEVVDCVYSKYITARDYAKSEQYSSGNGKKYVDVVLKVTNNLKEGDLADIFGYVKIGETAEKTALSVENEDNTKLLNYGVVESGKTGYVHLSAIVDENTDVSNAILRFNFGGNCYYIKAQ